MRETWGEHDLVPPEMLRALAESGNVPWGAFDADEMIGYVLGWAGVDADDGLHVHSHMLAAVPGRRHSGVGYAMKLAQRAMALDQGITLARWTFDPLIARNAHFNVTKLGAHCDRFNRNFYGEMSDSINAGDRSDRLVVRWDLEREPGPWPYPQDRDRSSCARRGRPNGHARNGWTTTTRPPTGSFDSVSPGITRCCARSTSISAGRWRDATGEVFSRCFAMGLRVVAFDADLEGGYPTYALASPDATVDWPEDVA